MRITAELFNRLSTSGQLPSLPSVVMRLLDLTQQADVSVREVADTITLDPILSAKILRFVNSPLAGLSREVNSLQGVPRMLPTCFCRARTRL